MVRNFKKWMSNLQPLWTCVGVSRSEEDDMRVEIEVVAHDPRRLSLRQDRLDI
jgi:enamine deaminase RidA (YjgF/YER057c/UK114 family)